MNHRTALPLGLSGRCLFAYGSLRAPQVFEAVAGHSPARFVRQHAILHGARAVMFDGDLAPCLMRQAHHSVHGVCYFNLPMETWQRLLFFEGAEYHPHATTVQLRQTNRHKQALCFWPTKPTHMRLSPWDFAAWHRKFGAAYTRAAACYMQWMDSGEQADLDAAWLTCLGKSGLDAKDNPSIRAQIIC